MKELAAGAPGPVAIAFCDLETDVRGDVHGDESFESASLVKLPVLVELYRRAEKGELKLTEEMVLEERFRVEGSGVLNKEANGTRWTLEKLARLMIDESDNIATDMLLDRLGLEALDRSARDLGLSHTTVKRTIFDFAAIDAGRDNLTSANDMARLLTGIGRGTLPGAAAMRGILEATRRRDMLPAGLPPGTKVAHKTGELTGVLHDAGLVTTPQGTYVLVMLAQSFPDREAQVRYWAQASTQVYKKYTEGGR